MRSLRKKLKIEQRMDLSDTRNGNKKIPELHSSDETEIFEKKTCPSNAASVCFGDKVVAQAGDIEVQ